jgi:hypothetical protein
VVLEEEDQSLLRGQISERVHHARDEKLLFDRLFQTARAKRQGTAVRHRRIAPRGFPRIEVHDLRAVSRRATVIEKRVDHDLPQPRVETRLAAKTFDRAKSLEPDFLREVFGVVAVAGVMQREHVESALVGACERREGFRIAALRALDQFAFALLDQILLRLSREMRRCYRHGARDLVGLRHMRAQR